MSTLSHPTRRALLRSGAALAASALPFAGLAQEAAPSARYHRFSFAEQELVVLSDGHLVVPTGLLAGNVGQTDVASYLTSRGLGPDRVKFHINVALVKTGAGHVLIDAGSGGTWEPTAGRLAESLEAAGLR